MNCLQVFTPLDIYHPYVPRISPSSQGPLRTLNLQPENKKAMNPDPKPQTPSLQPQILNLSSLSRPPIQRLYQEGFQELTGADFSGSWVSMPSDTP